jgi:carboxylesterase
LLSRYQEQTRTGAACGADAGGFFFPGGRIGCLLIHGFMATPQEMRFLGERLRACGYSVHATLLAGHGTSPEDLDRCTWHDWYASARAGLETLHRRAPEIVVIGQSLGALLALKLAVDSPAVIRGAVLLSPALVLSRRWLRWMTPVVCLMLPFLAERRRYVRKPQRDVADPRARAESVCYDRVPLRGLRQLFRLQQAARRVLPQVQQPVLVVHSRQDHTCPLVNVEMVQHAVRGPVRPVILNDSYHVVSIDVDKERVVADVAAFVEDTSGVTAAAPMVTSGHPSSGPGTGTDCGRAEVVTTTVRQRTQ